MNANTALKIVNNLKKVKNSSYITINHTIKVSHNIDNDISLYVSVNHSDCGSIDKQTSKLMQSNGATVNYDSEYFGIKVPTLRKLDSVLNIAFDGYKPVFDASKPRTNKTK